MLEIIKKSERKLDAVTMLKVFRDVGYKTIHIGEWDKWKNGSFGKYQVKVNVYCIIKPDNEEGYIMSDTLGNFMCPITPNKQDIMDWLRDKDYKTDKEFYTGNGMSEDTWNAWNEA